MANRAENTEHPLATPRRLAHSYTEIDPVHPAATQPHSPIQRYVVEQEPETRQLFSRSDDGNIVTGMRSPNHELYVRDKEALSVMNQSLAQSPLELYLPFSVRRFGTNMQSVGLRYKTKRRTNEAEREKVARGEAKASLFQSRESANLQAMYEKHILPNIQDYRDHIFADTSRILKESGLEKSVISGVAGALHPLTSYLNLFKKVITSELANKGDFDPETEELSQVARDLIQTVEEPLYDVDLTKAVLLQSRQDLLATWFDDMDREELNVIGKVLFAMLDSLDSLIQRFPEDRGLDMMLFQKYNFNREILAHLYSPDNVVLYRACDVMASTLLGNKLTEENAQLLKNYNARVDRAFHYATSILRSGNDWVTLEHFAASERERRISGTEDANLKNLDHTWQFIMQGTRASGVADVSETDKYFEVYTKIRYYLKGLVDHQAGAFDTAIRDHVDRAEAGRFVQLGGSGQLANVYGWRAFYERVADAGREEELINELCRAEYARSGSVDPLVHAYGSWDQLLELIRKYGGD